MPVILVTQEAEIKRITFERQIQQVVCETLSWKTHYKEDWWSGSSGKSASLEVQSPEFKP
jgi:hypothetical protein